MTRTDIVSIAEQVRVAGSETEWDSLIQAYFIQDTGHAIADRHGWQDLRRIVETSVHWNELARSASTLDSSRLIEIIHDAQKIRFEIWLWRSGTFILTVWWSAGGRVGR